MKNIIWIVMVLLAFLAGAVGWYAWRRCMAPEPPEVTQKGLDPELAAAIESARQKIYAHPYSAQSWGELGKLLRAVQLLPTAVACFAQAEQLDPKNPRWPYLQGEALRLSDNQAALAPLERAAALTSSTDTIAPFLRLAEVLLALGHNEEAEKHLRRALEIEPDNPTVHYHLALLALARQDLPGSLQHLKHCEHSPFTQRKACIQLAAIYQRMGQTEEAARYGHKADTLPPDSNWLDPFLADVLAVGRPARLQQIYQLELHGDYRTAVERLTALIQEKPDYHVYVGLGKDLGILGDFERAEQTLRSAITLAPEKFRAYYELSRLLWVRADKRESTDPEKARAEFEEAAACARQALLRRPNDAMAHFLLGMSLRRLGKRQEALDALRAAAECGPNIMEIHLYLGETLAEAGHVAEAQTVLEHARQLKPDDPRLRAALAKWKKQAK